MKKSQEFLHTRFTVEVLRSAIDTLLKLSAASKCELAFEILEIEHDDAKWKHDSPDEFFADYRKYNNRADFRLRGGKYELEVWAWKNSTHILVTAPSRAEIESVFSVFESARSACQTPVIVDEVTKPIVFIGHGRSNQWRDLKDHLQEKQGYQVEAYETGARAGHTIRDILEDMVRKSSFAVLVLTAEDEQADGQYRARQNVVHEAGLFQGRLGFSRAIMLLEEGVEEFSNAQGIQYIRFSKNNIKETYGEILATLRREFGAI